MSGLDDLLNRDALAQAEAVRRGDVTARELLEATVARIERANPSLNAVIVPLYDQARASLERTAPSGPLAGVPFLLKDFLAEAEGTPLHEGTAFLKGYVSPADTELVRRYRRAGLVFLGKTNTPEMAIGVTTEPRLFGPTRNPWDTGRIAGGSSGGAAAAVASGMVAVAHGNDAGGSIRIPASCCGVFGLKPTRARNPLGPYYGDLFGGLVAEHVLTRSVRDSAALLDATAGPMPGDPYPAPPFSGAYSREVGLPPGPLRIAYSHRTPLGEPVHPDCAEAVRRAAELCQELGHHVEEAAPSFDGEAMWRGFTTLLACGLAWAIDDLGRRTGRVPTEEDFEPFVWGLAQRGRQVSAPEYLGHLQALQRLSRDIAAFFRRYDVWMTPTLGEPPAPLGTFRYEGGDPFELRRRMARFSPFTYICNVTGQPAMSVPLHWNEAGLPIGVHFAGPFGGEALLFRLAAQLEEARPWAGRRPPVWAGA